MSAPTSLLLRFVLTILLVWGMSAYLPQYMEVTGGIIAFIVIAALITLMNLFLSPILNILSLPLKLVMTLVAITLVNAIFLWVTMQIVDTMDTAIVTLEIRQGIIGFLVIATVLGIAKWLMHVLLKKR